MDAKHYIASVALPNFLRELQDIQTNATSGKMTNNTSGTTHEERSNMYSFIAYLTWYLFLILCCVIPAACSYRHRHRAESRRIRQVYLEGMAAQGPLSMYGWRASAGDGRETDEASKERLRLVIEQLKGTTMIVTADDLSIKKECDDLDLDRIGPPSKNDENVVEAVHDVDLHDSDRDVLYLQLGAEVPNGVRRVPAVCAICLCSYEVEDSVTHSPQSACQHAFHTECISTWLAKLQEPLCPCCRQSFCVGADQAAFRRWVDNAAG